MLHKVEGNNKVNSIKNNNNIKNTISQDITIEDITIDIMVIEIITLEIIVVIGDHGMIGIIITDIIVIFTDMVAIIGKMDASILNFKIKMVVLSFQ